MCGHDRLHFVIVTHEKQLIAREDLSLDERETLTGDTEREQMGRKHVLAVNGDPTFLELLQEEQYNVTTTNFVPKTFDLIACLQPSLLIVDLVIGKAAGWELLDHLQREAITRGIPMIATSTMQPLLDRAMANQERYGRNQYLVKPFDLDDLVDTIRKLIGNA